MVSAERVLGYCRVAQEASLESAPEHRPRTNWPAKGSIEVRWSSWCTNEEHVWKVITEARFTIRLPPLLCLLFIGTCRKSCQRPFCFFPPPSLSPKIRNMSMRYREDLPRVLKDLTLSITGGSRVGVVGRTGAGKSSLIAALFRLVECDKGRYAAAEEGWYFGRK